MLTTRKDARVTVRLRAPVLEQLDRLAGGPRRRSVALRDAVRQYLAEREREADRDGRRKAATR